MARRAAHLGANPRTLPIVGESFSAIEHPNAHLALEAWVSREGRTAELVGISSEHKRYEGLGMADLISPVRGGLMDFPIGPLQDAVFMEGGQASNDMKEAQSLASKGTLAKIEV